jgi:hypothetical protein
VVPIDFLNGYLPATLVAGQFEDCETGPNALRAFGVGRFELLSELGSTRGAPLPDSDVELGIVLVGDEDLGDVAFCGKPQAH